jgi:hypothetical protein
LRELRQQPRFQSSLSHVAVRRAPLSGDAEISVPVLRRAALSAAIVADSVGEQEPLKMQHFRGAYEKFRD